MSDWQQQQDDEERMMRSLEVLQRVSRGLSDQADALWLAAELGLVTEFKKEIA